MTDQGPKTMDKEREAVLKPCPFCGNQAISITKSRFLKGFRHYGYCNDCHATGPQKDTEAEAIAAWNTRQPTQTDATEAAAQVLQDFIRNIENEVYYWRISRQKLSIASAKHWRLPMVEITQADIVERLRTKYCCTTEDCKCDEAAAEIETLRAALLAERERCAKAIENMGCNYDSTAGERYAKVIRNLQEPTQ